MCSKMAAKLINSSDESSMGSAVYFSRRVFTENLKQKQTEKERWIRKHNKCEEFELSAGSLGSRVLYPRRQTCYCI